MITTSDVSVSYKSLKHRKQLIKLTFRLMKGFMSVAGPPGLEPGTSGSGGRRSIHSELRALLCCCTCLSIKLSEKVVILSVLLSTLLDIPFRILGIHNRGLSLRLLCRHLFSLLLLTYILLRMLRIFCMSRSLWL